MDGRDKPNNIKRENRAPDMIKKCFRSGWRAATCVLAFVAVQSLPAGLCAQKVELRENSSTSLWYLRPAQQWTEALPIGNGRLAAMAFGTFPRDRLQLNEETIWEGEPIDRTNPRALETLPKLREMLFTGHNAEAAKVIDECFVSPRRHLDAYQSAGELLVDFVGHGSAPATGPWMVNPSETDPNPWISGYGLLNYARALDLTTGITTSQGKFEHVAQKRESFVSWADDIVCYRVTCDAGEGDFDVSLQRELDVVRREVPDDGLLV
jgi:alpha-L-fucosidase 2